MDCLYYFKNKTRNLLQKSAPNLSTGNKSEGISQAERVAKSSCSAPSPRGIPELYEEKAQNLRVFKFSELKQATNNFNRLLKIGEGGFGSVYKGSIHPSTGNKDPFLVAIKQLNRDGYQGHKQWVAEVQFLGVVEHPNLVKLIGYCAVDGERGIQRLLVYEYMPNKSLEDHLFNKSFPVLTWSQRLEIVLGAARGLAYLHEELEIQVIYRDFKSSNVLLTEDFAPKLSDFGLAREGPAAGHTHVSTAVFGTPGYAAPDYIRTGHLTSKSDVWSFGVVLYEILTGRRSLEIHRPKAEQKLLDWVKHYPAGSRRFRMIMDPRFENKYPLAAAHMMAKLADTCLVKSAKDRPNMSQVVESVKQIVLVSSGESPPSKYQESDEDAAAVEPKSKGSMEPSASAKRRFSQLAKINELFGGNERKFLMTQKNKMG